jgi:hypothetical protein
MPFHSAISLTVHPQYQRRKAAFLRSGGVDLLVDHDTVEPAELLLARPPPTLSQLVSAAVKGF